MKKKQISDTSYNKAFKFRFYPDNEQIVLLSQFFGSARFVFNKTLDFSIKHYTNFKQNNINSNIVENKTITQLSDLTVNQNTLINDISNSDINITNHELKPLNNIDRLNHINTLKLEYTWLKDISSIVLQQSVIHLNNAYTNFFRKVSNTSIKNKGYPQFKKKGNRNSFKIVGKQSIHFNTDGSFTLPKFKNPLNIKFSRTFDRTKVSSITVSKEPSGHYYITFLSEQDFKTLPSINHKLAFDSGIKNNLTVYDGTLNNSNTNSNGSNGLNLNDTNSLNSGNIGVDSNVTTEIDSSNDGLFKVYNLPDLSSLIKKIKVAHRGLSRKVKGSNNRYKQRVKLARLYAKKENKVNDFYHKLTTHIVNDNQVIIVEDLNFSDMKSNQSSLDNDVDKHKKKNIRKNLQEVSLSKIYRQIEYKAKWYGKTLIYADRYYPSSKKCSTVGCDYINYELKLEERTWKCPQCKKIHKRDNNSALNLYYYDKDNAKQIINNVLAYHQHKKLLAKINSNNNPVIVRNKKPTKIGFI